MRTKRTAILPHTERCSYLKAQEHCLWFRHCDWKDENCIASPHNDLEGGSTGLLPWELVALSVGVQVVLFVVTLTIVSFPAVAGKLFLWRLWLQTTCRQWCISVIFSSLVHRHCSDRQAHDGQVVHQPQQQQNHQNQDYCMEMENLLMNV